MSKIKKILGFTATVVTALCFIYALAVLATQQAETAPKTTATTLQKAEPHIFTVDELLAEANRLRAEKGVKPLTIDPRLNESAQWKAQDMADYDYFGHVRDGYHGWQKVNELAPECVAGENIEKEAQPFSSPFDWWVTSKPHYEAILDVKYDTTGFGVVKNGDEILYVQHFCDL